MLGVATVKSRKKKWHPFRQQYPLPEITPWPVKDDMGMGAAVTMLMKSLEKGKLAEYTQFDSCRHIRGTIANIYTASSEASKDRMVLKTIDGKIFHLHSDPMQSIFMERFMKGMKSRMPEEKERNLEGGFCISVWT